MLLFIAAGAIGAMVSKDIVHRDLKPQNILLHHDGRTKNPRPQVGRMEIIFREGKLNFPETQTIVLPGFFNFNIYFFVCRISS